MITARLSAEEVSGTFETVDGEGNLVLVLAGGAKRHIPAADIFF
jgi:BirA family biotin operon repressor/biotin-[acetyl-CoA-carboxylase] ligase